ncbi:MAG TPA: hypothetical protein VGJ21_16155, partial [Terracidiphilus sp.]
MNSGRMLAVVLAIVTIVLVIVGTLHPVAAALPYAGDKHLMRSTDTPAAALQNLGEDIRTQNWGRAYASLANKAEFTEGDFTRDMVGAYPNLRTYSHLEKIETRPLHETDSDAEFQLKLHWATVVGDAVVARNVHLLHGGSGWQVEWPIVKQAVLPPQV